MRAIFPAQLVPGTFPLGGPGNKSPSCLGFALGSIHSLSSWIWSTCVVLKARGPQVRAHFLFSPVPQSCFQFPRPTVPAPTLAFLYCVILGWRVIRFPTFLTPSGELSAVVTRITDSHVSSGFTGTKGKQSFLWLCTHQEDHRSASICSQQAANPKHLPSSISEFKPRNSQKR